MKKNYLYVRITLLLAVILSFTDASAQNTVSGRVTAATDNSPLPGIAVTVKGTTTGTATDVDGRYTLNNVPANATLAFSFIGFTTQEIPVGNRTTIDVQMAEDVKTLSEVVVIGYGEQRKQDATGGVVALGPRDYNKGVIATPEQLLQGRAAGVQVTPASGEPGAGVNIRIRGTTSIRGGNNPLFVVDGVPLDGGGGDTQTDFGAGSQSPRNPLTFLNPADIENITVLKDASAAAIYGSRGANGVVLITTKKGKAGQQTFNFSASASSSSTLKRYNLLSASEFVPAVQAAGGDATAITVNAGGNTDWQNEIFRTSISQNYSMDFGGGNDNTRYLFSLGYSDQQGIIKNSGLQRLVGRINASHELFNDKVTLDLNLTTSGIRDQFSPLGENVGFQGNLLGAALQANPTYPVYDAQGRYFVPGVTPYDADGLPTGDFRNPVAMLRGIDDNGNTNRTLARLGASWKIIEGLTYRFNLGIDNTNIIRRTAIQPKLPGFQQATVNNYLNVKTGFAQIQQRYRNNTTIEHTLTYNKKVGIGTLEALAGFGYYKFDNRGNSQQASNFIAAAIATGLPLYDQMGGVNNSGSTKSYWAGTDRSQNEIQSYFGRLNYNINDKYLITATVRVDGSSRFGVNNKYGTFPSVALGWRLSEEGFLRDKDIFSDLKLRLNWGLTGNQEFPGSVSRVIFNYDSYNGGGTATAQNNPNPNIRWEQTQQYGAGLDFALLQGRLSGTIDYFKKGTKDLLFQAFQAQPAATNYRWVNLPGDINNEGLEFTLNYDVLREQKLRWQVSYNMTYLTNKVSGIGTTINTGAVNGQGLSGAYAQQIREGYPVGAFFLRDFAGYDETGKGIYPNGELLTYAGNAIPKYNFGLNNSFSYGPLSLSFFLNASTGFYVYNNTANAIFIKGNLRNGKNVTREVANSSESPDNFAEVSSRFLEKGDFLRLTNFTLGYNFNLPASFFAKSLQLTLTGQNVFLVTSYSGVDPEVNTNKAIDGVTSIGMDYTSYPSARTFTLGLNVGF